MISYKTLEVWIYSMKTAKEIYDITKSYPIEERFGLISQTNRAAVSIAANIAEGVGRNTKNDTLRFLHISRGSAYELETLLCLALMANILNDETYNNISKILESNIRLLNGYINYLKQKP